MISNDSSKTVKSIRLAVRQHISLQDQSGNERINAKCNLSELESDHECPIKRRSVLLFWLFQAGHLDSQCHPRSLDAAQPPPCCVNSR